MLFNYSEEYDYLGSDVDYNQVNYLVTPPEFKNHFLPESVKHQHQQRVNDSVNEDESAKKIEVESLICKGDEVYSSLGDVMKVMYI